VKHYRTIRWVDGTTGCGTTQVGIYSIHDSIGKFEGTQPIELRRYGNTAIAEGVVMSSNTPIPTYHPSVNTPDINHIIPGCQTSLHPGLVMLHASSDAVTSTNLNSRRNMECDRAAQITAIKTYNPICTGIIMSQPYQENDQIAVICYGLMVLNKSINSSPLSRKSKTWIPQLQQSVISSVSASLRKSSLNNTFNIDLHDTNSNYDWSVCGF
jgi:hypothetical protein